MKIAILTGSMEPGSDGVGDYTRIVAQELTRMGHQCCTVALRDRAATEVREVTAADVERAKASEGEPVVRQLRLPQSLPWSECIERTRQVLDDFAPDWVSLQFVPYSFHPKGLISGLARHLKPLLRGRHFQIMFHETWIGEGDWTFKQKLVGIMQRKQVLQFLRELRPNVIHTSNAIFFEQLRRRRIPAKMLHIFGNVPVTTRSGIDWLLPRLQAQNIPISASERNDWWLFGFFGSVYEVWPPEPLFGYIQTAARARNKRVAILSAGRQGDETVWRNLATRHPEFSFALLGKLSGEQVSEYFNALDFGIAASAYAFIGKSGSATTMLEHGLPLIINRDDWLMPRGLSPIAEAERKKMEARTPNMVKMGDDFAARLEAGLPRTAPRSFAREVAEQMLSDLQASDRAV